jgi:uncharacterized membrane protein YwzB
VPTNPLDNRRFLSGWHVIVVVRTWQSVDRVNLMRFLCEPTAVVYSCLFVYVILAFKYLRVDNSWCESLFLIAG